MSKVLKWYNVLKIVKSAVVEQKGTWDWLLLHCEAGREGWTLDRIIINFLHRRHWHHKHIPIWMSWLCDLIISAAVTRQDKYCRPAVQIWPPPLPSHRGRCHMVYCTAGWFVLQATSTDPFLLRFPKHKLQFCRDRFNIKWLSVKDTERDSILILGSKVGFKFDWRNVISQRVIMFDIWQVATRNRVQSN